jgi:tRNA (adenine22-N1)-methyltransferase
MIKLNNRLAAAASFIERGSIVADIGTDHAYLPIWLVQNKITSGIIATDINEGPVIKAKRNIASYDLSDKIKVIKTDGLHGVGEYSPDTVVISGMGGESIRDIISAAPFVTEKKTRLIMQPMTHAPLLRRFLYDNGFDITSEKLAYDDRIYEIICAQYDGKKHDYTESELLIGKKNIEKSSESEESFELLRKHIEHRLYVLSIKISGIKLATLDASADEMLKTELTKLLIEPKISFLGCRKEIP